MSTKLEPGTYRVTKDLPAPTPDKRVRHDWRYMPIKAGMLFVISEEKWIRKGDLYVWDLKSYSHCRYSVSDPKAKALLEHLERVEETPRMWMHREGHENSAMCVLDLLVRRGRLTLDDVKWAISEDEAEDRG